MTNLMKLEQSLTMSIREIAELTGKLETTTPLVTPVGDIFIKQNFNK